MNKSIALAVLLWASIVADPSGAAIAGSLKDDVIFIPPPPWEGRFIGFFGGYGVGGELQQAGKTEALLRPVNADGISSTQNASGGVFGVQLGYNHILYAAGARGLFVGALIDAMSISGKTTVDRVVETGISGSPGYQQRSVTSSSAEISNLATARLRVGLATEHVLLYLSGGLAGAKIKAQTQSSTVGWNALDVNGTTSTIAGGGNQKNSLAIGYVLGGGLEIRISERWSMGVDYGYFQIPIKHSGSIEVADGYSGANLNYDVKGAMGDHLVKIQMNYALSY